MATALEPSQRGLANIKRGRLIDFKDELSGVPLYDPKRNPDGLVDLSGASNETMRDVLVDYAEHFSATFSLSDVLEYGPVAGPEELNRSMSLFFNDWFSPARSIQASNILATNGVSSLIDVVAFNVCDFGEGVLLPTPNYSMFEFDLCARAGISIIPVHTPRAEDQFRAECSSEFIKLLDTAYDSASRRGIRARALLLSNPSNPLGRFYSRETLVDIAKFCGKRRIHLIADEIYALSSFATHGREKLPDFTSVLSLDDDPKNGVLAENIHTLYGVSKDWAMGGLRLGFFVTRNANLWKACRRLALFTWVPHFSTQFWLDFVNDKENVCRYVHCNRARLQARYQAVASSLDYHEIPYLSANGGLFIWINLSKWLQYFHGTDEPIDQQETRETQLCRHLIKNGVFLSMGELCLSSLPGYFRFVYTMADDEALVAVRRIKKACLALENGFGGFSSMPLIEAKSTGGSSFADDDLAKDVNPGRFWKGSRKTKWFNCLLCYSK